jgi:hypothetical protein
MQLGHALWWVLVGKHADKPCAYSVEGMLSFALLVLLANRIVLLITLFQ